MKRLLFIIVLLPLLGSAQIITTFAGGGASLGDGGPADSAQLGYFAGIAIAKNGDVFIADPNHNRIRKVNAITKIITTVAGNGVAGFNGDGGLATNAELNTPTYVAVDNSGNIYISDPHNHRIEKIISGISRRLCEARLSRSLSGKQSRNNPTGLRYCHRNQSGYPRFGCPIPSGTSAAAFCRSLVLLATGSTGRAAGCLC